MQSRDLLPSSSTRQSSVCDCPQRSKLKVKQRSFDGIIPLYRPTTVLLTFLVIVSPQLYLAKWCTKVPFALTTSTRPSELLNDLQQCIILPNVFSNSCVYPHVGCMCVLCNAPATVFCSNYFPGMCHDIFTY